MTTRWILAALAGIALAVATAPNTWADPDTATTSNPLWGKADNRTETDDGSPEAGEKQGKNGFGSKRFDSGSLFAQSLVAVLVILVLGGAAIFVVKRLLPRLGVSHGRRINVLETVYLGTRKSLHLVQVADRTLLVGDTRERLGLLADLTGSAGLDDMPRAAPVRRKKPEFVLPADDTEEN